MTDKVKIVSDGTSFGTKVFVGDVEVSYIKRIEIKPIGVDGSVDAIIHVENVELDIDLDDMELIESQPD